MKDNFFGIILKKFIKKHIIIKKSKYLYKNKKTNYGNTNR